ncbi:unnamed protein product [Cylindrotheca closterium]|uniref:Phosphodiesterase n=1 Tax=Cylindrotheca closterium TaxID=2856 RepID=A0AAD2G5K2_9STRA|nr:unnamed protein product [Cylindrotheca closterium]
MNNNRYASEDNGSVAEISASGQTHGNMSATSESGIESTTEEEDYNQNKKAEVSNQNLDVARREQKAVNRSKLLVALFLFLAACATAAVTYRFVEQQERNDFEGQFRSHADEIVVVTKQKTDQLFRALNSFSISVASEAQATDQAWPFVTISDWSAKAQSLGELIGVPEATMAFCPVVNPANIGQWTSHTMENAPKIYQDAIDTEGFNMTAIELMRKTTPLIFRYDLETLSIYPSEDTALPVWQSYPFAIEPTTQRTLTNIDLMSFKQFSDLFFLTNATLNTTISFSETLIEEGGGSSLPIVSSQIMQPIFKSAKSKAEDREMAGVVYLTMEWTRYFEDFFTEETDPITLVLVNSCPTYNLYNQESFAEEEVNVVSYEIKGPVATYLGEYDAHDPQYDALEVTSILVDLDIKSSSIPSGQCIPKLSLHLYPTEQFEETFYTVSRFLYTGVIIAIFLFTSFVFLLYDYFVGRRQRKVMDRIIMQDQLVANVFPTAIRNRLYDGMGKSGRPGGNFVDSFDNDYEADKVTDGAPMADLFPNTSIVFADIVGFTAWSSAREPQQVFALLETIYAAFDRVAYRHNVFKVETVGDSYVAAAGLPEPMEEHAVAACKFARDCMRKMKDITLKLEVSLGPDTSDLELRVGIHSGQVTAGVLRGERSRFQLFGDTVNTAARMESTGRANCIQITETTAHLLRESGFANMIIPRGEKTFVKGKGEMQTYWLRSTFSKKAKVKGSACQVESTISEEETTDDSFSVSDREDDFLDMNGVETMNKTQRLVEWNVEVLSSLLQQIVTSRGGSRKSIKPLEVVESNIRSGQTILEEFVPIIQLKRAANDLQEDRRKSPSTIDIGNDVKSELRIFLARIADLYTDSNPFHNFEHASHVTASVKKLLKRIVNVDPGNGLTQSNASSEVNMVDLAGHSYGITSDPLTQFAVVFAAIIHDVDHPGVPNTQLVKEGAPNAKLYKNKSVAEQNSVDIAWKILMQKEYESLRSCIYQTEGELRRFRQLVVNTVMATDIVDKELQALRKARWETAFSSDASNRLRDDDSENRKATIVIEHLIQASDVVHTMQHWHIYKSWNEKFFCECYKAYKSGRADVDPSINWYKGEIGFFDFYVIPLAKKLDDCGVFGVSSHEYLNYAMANRDEWVRDGEELVNQFLENNNQRKGKQ